MKGGGVKKESREERIAENRQPQNKCNQKTSKQEGQRSTSI